MWRFGATSEEKRCILMSLQRTQMGTVRYTVAHGKAIAVSKGGTRQFLHDGAGQDNYGCPRGEAREWQFPPYGEVRSGGPSQGRSPFSYRNLDSFQDSFLVSAIPCRLPRDCFLGEPYPWMAKPVDNVACIYVTPAERAPMLDEPGEVIDFAEALQGRHEPEAGV